jgi:uncharacterized protein (TIGR04255 family)
MSSADTDRKPLSLPWPQDLVFERNFLKTVVCELKFPTLLELETEPPARIRAALKKEYPHYGIARSFGVRPDGITDEQVPKLESIEKRWAISIRPSAISIETSKYKTFEELRERVLLVVQKALPFLDTNFFTRVGLRYINHLPVAPHDACEWFNENLVAPLRVGVFGDIDSCYQEIRGVTTNGSYSLRHGYQVSEQGPKTYVFDADLCVEPLEADRLPATLDHFHVQADSLFQWALTDAGRRALGVAQKKKNAETR